MNILARRSSMLLAVLLPMLLCVPACRPVPKGLYAQRYENGFTDVALPSEKDIMASGLVKTYAISADEAWRTCLRLANQRFGVLAVDRGTGGDSTRRLMVLTGLEHIFQPAAMGSPGITVYMDAWLAIAVTPDGPESCKVGVAWVHPETNKVAPYDPAPDPNKTTNFFSSVKDKILAKQKCIPSIMIMELHQTLLIQAFGPSLWMARLKAGDPTPRGAAPGVVQRPDPGYPELKYDYGNWCSLYLRRNASLVDAPEIVAKLTQILNNLKKAAGAEKLPNRIYIMASPEVNAFSMPNGDIYICAGLMDLLSDSAQVAAVLGHELDHYLQHDAVYKIKHEFTTTVVVMTIMIAGSAAAGVGGALIAPASAAINASTSVGQQVGQQLLSSGLQQVIANGAAYGGMGLQDTIVMGYSKEVELRADNNGMRYVWSAGYDPKAMLQVMDKLKGIEVAAKEARSNCGSALVNCQPGVEARVAQLQDVMGELGKAP